MRRDRLPALFVLLGLLVAGITLGLWLGSGGSNRASSVPSEPPTPPTAALPPTVTTPAPPPPAPTPPTPASPAVVGLTPFAGMLTWSTAVPSTLRVAVGTTSLGPTRWLPASGPSTSHAVPIGSLTPGRTYAAWLELSEGGVSRTEQLGFTTPAVTTRPVATTDGGVLRLDGEPWVPLMSWGLCSDLIQTALVPGVNLLAANPCGGLEAQVSAAAGRALSAGTGADAAGGPGEAIGWFHPDEADAHGYRGENLPPVPMRPVFLTLTNHFYSGAAPLPEGRGMVPGLIAASDVVGFDLYPLQEWCRPERIGEVFESQQELVALAPGKPTFQWIEAAAMKCGTDGEVAITPQTVRLESWLAFAGGAQGLGFFPTGWTAEVEKAIARVAEESAALTPALTGERLSAEVKSPLRAGARRGGGALLVAVANPTRAGRPLRVTVPGLGGRELRELESGRTVRADGDTISDTIGPLAVRLYVARA
ncbi:MAG: hypothetical protein ACKVUT_04050 [Gaiella sp.]